MDDLMDQAGDTLKKMGDDLKIYPFQDREKKDRLFLARFEFPKWNEQPQFPDAVKGDAVAFIDFLLGFPIDCVEMLLAIGELSTKADMVTVQEGKDRPVSPIQKFFKWPDKKKILLNLTALPTKNVSKILVKNLEGEPKPVKVHWWFRVQILKTTAIKFPVPGEFLALGNRMMPDKPWGKQKSSPFIYAGNWMDTVYYTSCRIKEVIEATATIPYRTYKVMWRKNEVTARPSDFAEYKVDDRVTLLKDVATTKRTQLWKDDDMKYFGGAEDMAPADIVWQIAPISFYGLDREGG